MTVWDPVTYLEFADERSRPFVDLLSRVPAAEPTVVVDLGCGPGQLTASLADRWPHAQIVGLDSSPEMIMQAAQLAGPQLRFQLQDLRDWRPETGVDVIISNATLQWIPGTGTCCRPSHFARPDGWLAFQVPGNFDEPSHRLLRQLSADPRYAPLLTDVAWPSAADAASYLDDLVRLGCSVDAWETTYLHPERAASSLPLDFGHRCPAGAPGITGGSSWTVRLRVPGVAEQRLPDSAVRDRSAFSAYLRRGPARHIGSPLRH